ncbi:MAG: sulfurtransferase complex subunit TusD [Hahellaceae bacterium]|nr:sulfurtransferase complex subunit TusD [Hahellaceae bacterium]
MKFVLVVYGDPQSSQSPYTALRFAQAALAAGHTIPLVFFYHNGGLCGLETAIPPQDEPLILNQWQALADNHGTELVVCVGSALRRGIADTQEAKRHNTHPNLHAAFRLGGLGELVSAGALSDRLITFAD